MRYDEKNLSPADPSTIYGYFQSEKYFKGVEKDIRKVVCLDSFASCISPTGIYEEICDSNSVAIHVRRQDYVSLQHFHGMPPIEYYREGIRFISQKIGMESKVFVFSDDKQWCRENFPSTFCIVDGTNKYEDLYLMSLCRHVIVANSSFSWFGAWLGDSRNSRIIVAPKHWFADPSVDDSDIVPETWVRI
jgi:Glycosyl transferase family 11